MTNAFEQRIQEAIELLRLLGLPRGQQNIRSALCLLALLDLQPQVAWQNASDPLMGVTPIMQWIHTHYGKTYAPNTRETIRRQTLHQFVAAGIALYNPDKPERPVNSPYAVYQIEPSTLTLMQTFQTGKWSSTLKTYLTDRTTLVERYARERSFTLVPVQIDDAITITLSPGEHSELIRAVIEEFAPRFAPNSRLVYVGDTGNKLAYFDTEFLEQLGVSVDEHGKMPDVVLYFAERDWLLLVETVTSHGPVDSKRYAELAALFSGVGAGIVYVTAFPTRSLMARYVSEIAWETEVWIAESPSHLIHFNGERFLGPYTQ